MSTSTDIELAAKNSLSNVDPSLSIRPKQLAAIKSIFSGRDTLAILPTSYGKSMIFRLIPAMCKALKDQPDEAVVIVIVPLISIIADQVDAANKLNTSLGLNACKLSLTEYDNISNGKYNIIVGTPESWLNPQWENVLSSTFFRKNLKCIVVDEVHQVSWGYGDKDSGELPFREAFSRIGVLRSFCGENVPVLALSATVTSDYCDLITMSCSLSSNFKLIVSCPDRPNIRLSVVKCPEKSVSCFEFVIESITKFGVESPRMLIYCKSQMLVGWLYEQFLIKLTQKMFKDGVKSTKNAIVAMYHADTLPHIKDDIVNELTNQSSDLRIVICTSALGCGVDCKNIKFIFHFGPPYNLIDYCQQIGRAGRSNEADCHAILLNFPGSLTKLVSNEMKAYVKSLTCLRTALFSSFNEDAILPIHPLHSCCSHCAKDCNCELEGCSAVHSFEEIQASSSESLSDVSDSDLISEPKRARSSYQPESPQYEFDSSLDDLEDFEEDLAPGID